MCVCHVTDGSVVRIADETVSQKLVDNTCTTLQNFAVVGSMLFSGTYLAVIGRPVPWTPSDASAAFLQPEGADTIMWLTYTLATWITTLCLSIIVYSVGSRFMLTYILESVESKLCFLCEVRHSAQNKTCRCLAGLASVSPLLMCLATHRATRLIRAACRQLNPVSVASRSFMIVIMLLLLLLGMGGMLSAGRGWGFVGCAAFPFALAQCYPLFSQLRNGSVQLHLETRSRFGMSSPSTKEPRWGRVNTEESEAPASPSKRRLPSSPAKWRVVSHVTTLKPRHGGNEQGTDPEGELGAGSAAMTAAE